MTAVSGAWAESWPSGDCTVTLSGGVMTVSGTGAMGDDQPWSSYKSEITSVVIENGVTSIGNYAFTGCGNLTWPNPEPLGFAASRVEELFVAQVLIKKVKLKCCRIKVRNNHVSPFKVQYQL